MNAKCFIFVEPTRENAQELQSALIFLLESGKLLTFETFVSKFEEISMDSQRSHVDWFPTFHIMLQNLKEESKSLLGGFPIETTETRVAKYRKVIKAEASEGVPKRFAPREVLAIDSTNRSHVK